MKRIAMCVMLLAACGDAETTPEPDANASNGGKSDIYGSDSRKELFDRDVLAAHKRVAASTAIAIGPGGISDINGNTVTLNRNSFAYRQRAALGAPLCSSERFLSQPAPGFCSAFLIAPDLVATAGHCVNGQVAVHEAHYVFGFGYNSISDDVTKVSTNDMYRGVAVVGHFYDKGEVSLADQINQELWNDWAVVQLDRPVTGRTPVTLRDGAIAQGELATAIGHPSGLPTKVTAGTVVDASKSKYFNTDMDIYQGNSGSMVADQNGNAIGIAIRGSGGNSFELTPEGCYASKRCDSVGSTAACIGNHVMRAYPLKTFADPSIRRVISQGVVEGTPAIPDNNPAGVTRSRTLTDSGAIEFVTLNVKVLHGAPQELEFYLEHNGKTVAVSRRPRVWSPGEVRFSRTTDQFAGLDAAGEWKLKVVDGVSGNTGTLEWWQLVVGIGNGRTITVEPVEPPSSPSFVGTACTTDADCDFSVNGNAGFCYANGGSGFCSLPCDGYCPDASGFAPTFCIPSDTSGTGVCASQAGGLNNYCAAIPGTTMRDVTRYVGTSNAPATTKAVCAP